MSVGGIANRLAVPISTCSGTCRARTSRRRNRDQAMASQTSPVAKSIALRDAAGNPSIAASPPGSRKTCWRPARPPRVTSLMTAGSPERLSIDSAASPWSAPLVRTSPFAGGGPAL